VQTGPEADESRPRVLVADDNAEMRGYLDRLLGGRYKVQAVGDGQAALEAARKRRPDLVLSDVAMPRLDGMGLVSELRADPLLKTVPIILVSGLTGEESRVEGIQQGADDYILKPFSARDLLARVALHLEKARMGREADERIRQKEAARRESEERFRSVLEASRDVIYRFNLETGRYDYISPSAGAVVGFSAEELMEQSTEAALAMVHPDDRLAMQAAMGRLIETGEAAAEYRQLAKSGEYRWLSNWMSLTTGIDGQPLYRNGNIRDITAHKRAEQALEASEKQYRNLFETMTEGFALFEIICDEAGKPRDCRCLAVNPAFERQTSLKAGDVLGRGVVELFRDIEPVWGERFGRVVHSGEPARFEERFGPLGRWFDVSAFRTEPGRFGVVFSDITERKRAEEERQRLAGELAARAGELQALLDAVPVAVWMAHDPQCLRITGNAFADQMVMRVERGANVSRSARPGESIPYRVLRDGMELRPEELPAQLAASTGQAVEDREFNLVFPDGRSVHMLMGAVPLFDTEGRVRGSVAAGLDVTGRKQSEDALRESEERFRSMADGCPSVIWVTDAEGENRFVNRAYREFFGVTSEEVEGHKWKPLIHPADEPEYVGAAVRAVRDRAPFKAETRIRRNDGEWRWVASYGEPRFSPGGEFLGHGGISMDVTDRNRAKEALRESEERLRLTLDAAQVGTLEFWPGTGKVLWDDNSKRIWGFAPGEEWTYSEAVRRVHPDDRERLEGVVRAALDPASDGCYECEHRILLPDGSIHWVAAKGQVYFEGEGENRRAVRMIGIELDTTERKQAEEALRESEEQFRVLTQNLKSAVALVDEGGAFRIVNSSFLRLFDIPEDADIPNLNSRDWSQWQVFDERGLPLDVNDRPARKAAASGTAVKNQLIAMKPRSSLELKWLLVSAEPILGAQGKLHRLICTYYDITERKRAEEALRESEAQFRTLANAIPQLCWMANANGWIFWTNERCHEYTGLTREQMEGWSWKPVLDGEMLPAVVVRWENSLATGEPFEMILPLRGRDGVFRPFLTRVMPLRDHNGKVARWVGTSTDISEQRKNEEALREAEKRERERAAEMQAIMDAAPAVVIVARDAECRSIMGNRTAYQLFNAPYGSNVSRSARGDEATTSWRGVKDGRDLSRDELPMRLAAASGRAVRDFELGLEFEDGTSQCWLGNVEPLFEDGGRPRGAVGVFLDITERKRTEQQRLELLAREHTLATERALRESEAELARVMRGLLVSEMATSVAHEVNQPLAGVITNAGAAQRWLNRETPDLDEARECLALIVRDGTRAGDIIRRIREFTRKGSEPTASLDMNEVIREAAALAHGELVKRHVDLRMELAGGLPRVRGDRIPLQQVLLNLIMNGADAMDSNRGPRELLVTTRKSIESGGWPGVHVAVRDCGVGIRAEDLHRMFDAFFTTKADGIGMGLSISRSIIEGHAGRIWAEAGDGPGLTVQFWLPAEGEDDEADGAKGLW
jgi:PAS domain S-box-containing protein